MEAYDFATEENEALKGFSKQPFPDYGIKPKFKEVEVTEESEAQEASAESKDISRWTLINLLFSFCCRRFIRILRAMQCTRL